MTQAELEMWIRISTPPKGTVEYEAHMTRLREEYMVPKDKTKEDE